MFGQQTNTTLYGDLETKMFYSVGISSETKNGKSNYEANGNKISESTYHKYKATWENMKTCCPCILKSYDESDILLREEVACTDCGVGWFKTYFKNGKVKLSGSYKENHTGDWTDIWNRGYCSVPDGQWTYFSENGDTLYLEFWENGKFIKQSPEQLIEEIWDIEIQLYGQDAMSLVIPIANVGSLAIEPKYKNSISNSTITVKFEVSAIGHKRNKKEFTLESFKKIDVNNILDEVGIPNNKKTNYVLSVFSDEKLIKSFYLNIEK